MLFNVWLWLKWLPNRVEIELSFGVLGARLCV